LLEDQAGGLWIGSDRGGLTRMFNGRFQPINLEGESGASVIALLDDSAGRVWAALAGKGFVRIPAGQTGVSGKPGGPVVGGAGQRTEMLPSDTDVLIATTVFGLEAITRDAAGRIWAASEQHLHTYQDSEWRVRHPDLTPGIR
jgi:ligand-binding sensor domain-containing protein